MIDRWPGWPSLPGNAAGGAPPVAPAAGMRSGRPEHRLSQCLEIQQSRGRLTRDGRGAAACSVTTDDRPMAGRSSDSRAMRPVRVAQGMSSARLSRTRPKWWRNQTTHSDANSALMTMRRCSAPPDVACLSSQTVHHAKRSPRTRACGAPRSPRHQRGSRRLAHGPGRSPDPASPSRQPTLLVSRKFRQP
jgi:hypothetical protein